MSEPWRIGGASLLLAVALVGLVGWEGQARTAGQEVALPMAAVDPRDLAVRRSVELQLVQALDAGAPCPPGTDGMDADPGPFDTSPAGWVALREVGGAWRVAGVARTRREAGRFGPVLVRGSAECREVGGASVELDVGVGRFHAERDEAEAIQRLLSGGSGRAEALISVGRDGRARLKGVRIDGRRVELDWL